MRFPLVLLILSACLPGAFCQEYSYTHYDVKDGLAGSVVYCAVEDREGFLWFGTETGLSRFDGTHFRNFTTADGLPDNEILKLYVDSKNRVWMIPFKNSVCYYWKGRIYNADNDSILHRLSLDGDIFSIREDRYGNIVILSQLAIEIITPQGRIKKADALKDRFLLSYVNGGLTRDTVFVFVTDSKKGASRAGDRVAEINALGRDGAVTTLKQLPTGLNMVCNQILLSPGLNVFHSPESILVSPVSGREYQLPAIKSIINLSQIDDSLLLISTADGAIAYNLAAKKKLAHFLKGRSVNDVISDSEGNFWLMCAGNGIFRIGSLAFKNIRFPGNGNSLSVTALQENDNLLLAGTDKSALWAVDLSLRWFHRLPLQGFAPTFARVTSLKPIDKKRFLMATGDNIIEVAGFRVVPHKSQFGFAVKAVTRLSDSTWLINSSQLAAMLHLPSFEMNDTFWIGRSTCSYKKDSLIYIGTLNGLYVIGPDRRSRFLGDVNPVFKRRIAEIGETPDGVLWVATYGQGVAGYKDGKLLFIQTEEDGLTSNICRCITVAGNDVWVGTDKGLNRIRRQNDRFEVMRFTTADGLGSDIINSIYTDGDNVYVGTDQGLVLFNIRKIAVRSFCKLRVTSVQTSRHTWPYDTCGFMLPHRENSIRIDFVGISFRSAGDITYKYRLLGLSDAWHTTRETFLSYPTLPSGQYILELVAANKFDVKSKTVRVVFTVEKLLWEKTWFLLLTALVAAAIIWFFVSMRIRQIKRKNQEKITTNARITELEQMALKAQMNPHFIFNSLNSIQQYVIDRDFRGANKFITGFSRLIRLTLEMSSRAGVSIDEEINYISTYLALEKSRFEDKFGYSVELGPGIDPLVYQIPPMILQPYVENSIRHGVRNREDNEGRITIRFEKEAQYLVCVIEDNGVGRPAAEKLKGQVAIEYQSRGMALTASRVEMINKANTAAIQIHIEDVRTNEGRAAGTKIIIRFPLQEIIKPTSLFYD